MAKDEYAGVIRGPLRFKNDKVTKHKKKKPKVANTKSTETESAQLDNLKSKLLNDTRSAEKEKSQTEENKDASNDGNDNLTEAQRAHKAAQTKRVRAFLQAIGHLFLGTDLITQIMAQMKERARKAYKQRKQELNARLAKESEYFEIPSAQPS